MGEWKEIENKIRNTITLQSYYEKEKLPLPKTDEEIKKAIELAYSEGIRDEEYKRKRRLQGEYYEQTYKINNNG